MVPLTRPLVLSVHCRVAWQTAFSERISIPPCRPAFPGPPALPGGPGEPGLPLGPGAPGTI